MSTRFVTDRDDAARWRTWHAVGGALLVVAASCFDPSPAVAQDLDLEECDFACQSGLLTADPGIVDVLPPDAADPLYVASAPPPMPVDSDGDGLTDGDETAIYGTDPYNPDSNGNGIPDGYEGLDSDHDGVGDWHEIYVYGTDPLVADQPVGNSGSVGGDAPPSDQPLGDEEDCTYVMPDNCFPRVKPQDESGGQ
jgi:hypothetical protein